VIPEEKAALIVWRITVPSVPFEEFERHLVSQHRLEWSQAMGVAAVRAASCVSSKHARSTSASGRCLRPNTHEWQRNHYEEGDRPRLDQPTR
jgi:hypothetical protein